MSTQEQVKAMQAQIEELTKLLAEKKPAAGRVMAGVSKSNPNYLWVRHPKIKTLSKAGKEFIPTVSMPKEALLSLLGDAEVRKDISAALKAM